MQLLSTRKSLFVTAVLLSVYYILFFYPIMESGYYSDDIFLSQSTKGRMLAENATVCDLAKEDTKQWMLNGRFAPLSYLSSNVMFGWVDNIAVYKALLTFLNLAAVAAFAVFLYLLRKDKPLVLLTLILLPALMQFRVMFHDAYTTFCGLYPHAAIFNFGALSLYVLYARQQRVGYLIGSILLLAIAFCFVEMALAFMPLYLLVVLLVRREGGESWFWAVKKLVPAALVAVAYLVFTLWLRVNTDGHSQYPGLKSSFEIEDMLGVLHMQTFSTIPLIYINYEVNFMGSKLADIFEQMVSYTPAWIFVSLAVIAALLLRVCRANLYKASGISHKWFFWAGICLLLFPAVLIMPSVKYQEFARPGNGYLPVYLQNMGTAMLLALLIQVLLSSSKCMGRYIGLALVSILLLVVPITFANNCRVVAKQNYDVYYPSLALEKALDDGLLDGVAEHDVIWLASNYHWGGTANYAYLFLEKTGKHFTVVNEAKPGHLQTGVYQLSFPPGHPNVVTLKKVAIIQAEGTGFEERETKTLSYSF